MTTNPEKSGQSRLNLENPSLDQNQDQDYLDDIDGMLLASTDDTNCDSSPSDTGTDTGRVFHVAGVGPVNQSVDSNNVVTTSFPEGSKLQTIKYDPANKEDPYTVKFRDGNHDAELEKVVKEGRFCLPVLLEPQSEDPDSIDFFDPYFNQVGELEDKQGSHRLYPDGRLVKGDNIESSEIDKDRDTDKPFFTGIEKPFEYGAEKGCLYTDEQAGYVQGINFSEGKRKGQQYRFDRDEKGNVTSIEAKIPGEGGDTRQISIRKSGDNWQIEPADARIPRFETLKVDAKGVLTGDFKVKDNGDIVYDAKDGTKEAVRIDGSRDQYNLNEYSRIRESAEGAKSTEYWDGYNWRQGQAQMGTDGTTTINFPPEAGKPAQVIRDARVDENGITSNKFKVVFAGGKSYDADWGKQKMTYASQQGSVDLYNSGVTSDDGKSVWMQGRQVGTANDAAVVELKPGTEHQSKRMAAGQTPYRVAIHNNGEVTSVFKDGPQIRSDGRGNVSQIVHTNGQEIDVIRDANQNVVELKGSDGRQIVREKVLQSGADGSSQSRYQITDNGKSVGSIDGAINFGPAGRLDIEGSNN
ncbi:MAG: hypothetical protein K8F91_13050, partial [Candidatus Obscuribacterales bacterium]|nr:hypothetical protein [Candidatus Obscuribacterales bacterium]